MISFLLKYILLPSLLALFIGCQNDASKQINLFAVTYTNPILHLDYSDPDVVQVGQNII